MIYDIQKASMLKRISALLLDIIVIAVCTTGFMYVISAICNYDGYNAAYGEAVKKVEAEHNFSLNDYYNMSEEEIEENKDKIEAFEIALNKDEDVIRNYTMMVNIIILGASLGLFLSFLLFEFILPLILKNGQTIGKKIFSIGVVKCDCVKVNGFIMFVRAMLGKCVIGTMVPILLVVVFFMNIIHPLITVVGFLGIVLFQMLSVLFTRNHQAIHDIMSVTVVVDMSSQMIFTSSEELQRYKEKIHAQEVEKNAY